MNTRSPRTGAAILTAILIAAGSALAQDAKEAELIAVLKSDAPKADKAITCKLLAVYGTEHAVEELAKLLPDPQLTSWARTALEAIPHSSADEALRSVLVSLDEGRPLIGVINSIAVRRDSKAVDGLAQRLTSRNDQIAGAAAIALGHIGNPSAQQALEGSLASRSASVRSAVAEGCVLIAERLLESNRTADAASLYAKVRTADVPKQRVLEATRGLILAQQSPELLAELLHSPDKDHFAVGLRVARELPSEGFTKTLIAALEQPDTHRQSFVILALAQRDPKSVLPAILKLAQTGSGNVRASAIQVLGQLGDAATIPVLLAAATDRDAAITQSAKDALVALETADVNAEIKRRLLEAKGAARKVIIETIGARRIQAVPELLAATDAADSTIRAAALRALGATIKPQDLNKLIAKVTDPEHAADREIAHGALRVASTRMPDRDACAAELAAAMTGKSPAIQASIVEILGNVGGAKSLEVVAKAAADKREALKDAASQALGKWMTPDAAPVLLKLAQPKADGKYGIRALRGYLRIARQMKLTDAERAEMCEAALQVATRDAERSLIMRVLEIHPSLDTLAVALAAKKYPALKDAAHETSLRVAGKIQEHPVAVKKLLEQGGLEPANVEILHATYGIGDNTKVVTALLQENVGKLPIVSLSNYNTAFEGDPAPGQVKQLVVEYTIDGEKGTASFQENTPIILPKP